MEMIINDVLINNKITGVIGNYNRFLDIFNNKNFLDNKISINDKLLDIDEKRNLSTKISIISDIKSNTLLTVYEYMKHVIVKEFLNIKNYDKKIKDSLKIVGIKDSLLDRQIDSLSYTETKLISLASGLLKNPDIIVFDDFFNGFDLRSIRSILKLINKLIDRYKKNVIIFTNDIDFIYKYSSDLIVFNDEKKLIIQGKTNEVFEKEYKLLSDNGISIPNTILFTNKVRDKKKTNLNYNKDIRDLIKDIYKKV